MTQSRVYKYLLSFLILATFVVAPVGVSAMEVKNAEDREDIKITDNIDDNLMVFGDKSVDIDGDVKGDLYVAGGEVRIKGDISGNVYAIGGVLIVEGNVSKTLFLTGGNVEVRGDVSRNLYATAGTIRVEGVIKEDVFVAGGQVSLIGDIGDDAFISGGTVTVEGNVKNDMSVSAGLLRLDGNIGQDLKVAAGEIKIESEKIGGDVTIYTDNSDFQLSDSIEVGGEISIEQTKSHDTDYDLSWGWLLGPLFGFIGLMIWFLMTIGMILLGILVVKWAPVKVGLSIKYIQNPKGWLISVFYGLGFLIMIGFISVLLAFSLIGWPILTVIIGLAIAVYYIAFIISSVRIGKFLLKSSKHKDSLMWAMILGVLIVQLLILLPVLGVFVKFVVFYAGLGSLFRMKLDMIAEAK
jgi:hypothetical protein